MNEQAAIHVEVYFRRESLQPWRYRIVVNGAPVGGRGARGKGFSRKDSTLKEARALGLPIVDKTK